MRKYPRKVYAIFPYDKNGKAAGVYVGSSANMKRRLINHRSSAPGQGNQDQLHQLMRDNGCAYKFLDDISGIKENHVEYDWIDYFVKVSDFKVFNNFVNCHLADWTRISPDKINEAISDPLFFFGTRGGS